MNSPTDYIYDFPSLHLDWQYNKFTARPIPKRVSGKKKWKSRGKRPSK